MSFEVATSAISIRGISKYFPTYSSPLQRLKQVLYSSISKKQIKYNEKDFCALNNISFEIPKGDVVAILGRNGSGKSTLLQIICKTLAPSGGSLTINGRVAALLELGAGFNPEFTGRENIYLNAAILGLSKNDINEKLQDIINFSEIEAYIDQPVKHYSSGMFVRLAFSIAINVNPDILIIDEALSVGDARFQAKCIKKIQSIINMGATILFVSHDITAVRTLCKRAIWLDKGKLVQDGEVFEVSSKFMQAMYDETDSQQMQSPSLDKDTKKKFERDYVSHWGNHKGLIKKFALTDDTLSHNTVFELNQRMYINVEFDIPENTNVSDVNIAIAIKNLKGIDLIVLTAQAKKNTPEQEQYKVTFEFNNQLSSGEYLIVAALENNRVRDGFYYEYIEGIEFFISTSKDKSQGIFTPDAEITFS